MNERKFYLAIDLKSFYASVECSARGLDPINTNLVVADESRTDKTICLAVSPALKSFGIGGRCRLFEVKQIVNRLNEQRKEKSLNHKFTCMSYDKIELEKDNNAQISFIIAQPRMAYYMEVSSIIYGIYLQYISPEDIYSYSVDEVFIDASDYVMNNGIDINDFAKNIVRKIFTQTGITATCGIGSNLYLAKIAMDIKAKHVETDEFGVRVAELNEYSYRSELWDYKPITEFWRIGKGTANILAENNVFTMGDLARLSTFDQKRLFDLFGIDAELLIDHAWGKDECTLEQIREFEPENNSICDGQVLSEPYPYDKARIVAQEMSDNIMLQLMEYNLTTDLITMDIGYDRENCDKKIYKGKEKIDRYGRKVPPSAHGSIRLERTTYIGSQIEFSTLELFDRIVNKNLSIRRITITVDNLVKKDEMIQFNIFINDKNIENEEKLQYAIMSAKQKFGKNALLNGNNLKEGATMVERNNQIGGHKA